MSGQGGLDTEVGRLAVTDLSYHDNVRILTQKRSESRSERHAGFGVGLGLVDAWDLILDRILDG